MKFLIFWAKEPDKFYQYICPTNSGADNLKLNPAGDSNLLKLKCDRVLVCVAERDKHESRGVVESPLLGSG
jgi:hypothetical protein